MFQLHKTKLATQLVVIMLLVFAIVVLLLELYSYTRKVESESNNQIAQAKTLLRTLSSTINADIYEERYTKIENVLRNTIRFEQIDHVAITDIDGHIITETQRTGSGVKVIYSKRVLPVPEASGSGEGHMRDSIEVWHKVVFAGKELGWLHAGISKSYIKAIAQSAVKDELLYIVGIFVLASFVIIYFTNLKLASFRQLGLFASSIGERAGQRLNLEPVSQEIDQLVAELNNMSDKLARQQQNFIALAENSLDGFLVHQDGRHVFANASLASMLGYENAEQLIGTGLEDIVYHGELKTVRDRAQAREQGEEVPSRYETLFKTVTGEPLPVELNATKTIWEGRSAGMVAVRDISERKRTEKELTEHQENLEALVATRSAELAESELKFRTLFEASKDAVMTLDSDGFIDCNPATLAMFGYSTKDEFLGKHPSEISPPRQPDGTDSRTAAAERIETAFAKGKNIFEWMHRRANGEDFPAEVLLSRMELDGNLLLHALVRDITDRKQAEADIIAARDMAERANTAKSEFLSRVSHELRTPMNAILGFGQLLQLGDENLTDDQKQSVQQIMAGGKHLLNLINDILDITRLDTGLLDVTIRAVSLDQAVKNTLTMIKPLADMQHIDLNYQNDEELYVYADEQRLNQVLVNLLSNAVKYNRADGLVDVSAQKTSADSIKITITDSGIGIKPEDQAILFEPFSRVSGSAGEVEGTGIGLSITKKLVEMMNGQIGLESEHRKGTTFWVELPQAARPADSEVPDAISRSPLPINASGLKILYIEDNKDNILLMKHAINKLTDCELVTAGMALQGIELARELKPDLILMDISLPGMDGFQALEVLKSEAGTSRIPVVALSANAMPEQIEKGLQAGFVDYLCKPVELGQLTDIIDRFCKSGQNNILKGATP